MASTLCSDVKIAVCILTVLFGMGAWIATNATFVELPILVDHLPEGWNLPSYMAAVVTLANIGPIIVKSCGMVCKKNLPETFLIITMILTGSTASLCMAYFWTRTSIIAGLEHSTAFLVLLFFFALVDCSSSVVFLPFMGNFKAKYVTFYYVGNGFGGLLPSVMALAQGVGHVDCLTVNETVVSNISDSQAKTVYRPPRFTVKDFFLLIFAMMLICAIAFVSLNFLPYCKTEHVKPIETNTQSVELMLKSVPERQIQHATDLDKTKCTDASQRISDDVEHKDVVTGVVRRNNGSIPMSKFKTVYYLILTGLINALNNGILPSVQSYAFLPYGSGSYHMCVALSKIINPVASFMVFVLPVTSGAVVGILTSIAGGCSGYILMLAALSPDPPLVEDTLGTVIAVSSAVLVFFILSFTKVTIASLFRREGKKALVWYGAVTQLGSASGAVIIFVIINVYKVFIQKHPCV